MPPVEYSALDWASPPRILSMASATVEHARISMKKSHLIEPAAHWALPKPEIYRFMGFQGRVYYRFAGQFARSISAESLLNLPGINAQFQRNACPISPVWLRNSDGICSRFVFPFFSGLPFLCMAVWCPFSSGIYINCYCCSFIRINAWIMARIICWSFTSKPCNETASSSLRHNK